MPAPDPRAAYIDGLRILTTALEEHPEIPLPLYGDRPSSPLTMMIFGDPGDAREQMAAAARAFPCQWDKSTSGDGEKWLNLKGQLGGGLHVELTTYREAVCTRRVTGVEEREVEEEVTPAVTRTVVKTVETYEWDCHSILRPALNGEPAGVPS
jgi:hypothetical protein